MRKTHSSVHSTVSYYAFRIANPDFGSTRQEAMLPNHLRRSSLTLDIHTRLYRLIVVLVPEQSCIGFLFTFRTFLIGNSFNALFRLRVERCDSHSIGITNEWKHVVVDVVSQSFRHCLAVLTNVPARHDRVRRNSAFVFYIPRVTIHDLDETVSAELHQLGLQLRKFSLGADNEHNYIHYTCFDHRQTGERAYPLRQVLHMIVPYGLLSRIVDSDFRQFPTRASRPYPNRRKNVPLSRRKSHTPIRHRRNRLVKASKSIRHHCIPLRC